MKCLNFYENIRNYRDSLRVYQIIRNQVKIYENRIRQLATLLWLLNSRSYMIEWAGFTLHWCKYLFGSARITFCVNVRCAKKVHIRVVGYRIWKYVVLYVWPVPAHSSLFLWMIDRFNIQILDRKGQQRPFPYPKGSFTACIH